MAIRSLPKLSKPKPLLSCSFRLERESGYSRVVGIDEVGRGCLAGPVVVAGVVFPRELWFSEEPWLDEVNDSKLVKPDKRRALCDIIRKYALAVEVSSCSSSEVDQINILQATFKAARDTLKKIESSMGAPPEFILMDGSQKISQLSLRQHPVVGGDRISKSIAAASIIAKVYRDDLMVKMSDEFRGYGFEKHKGYGTKEHLLALRKLGTTPLHRRSFLKKLEAVTYGREAENLVAEFLEASDFKILARNWRSPIAEIDLVAEKNRELHFIEVRYRSQNIEIPMLFPPTKQAQVKRAAEIYMNVNSQVSGRVFHVDFISVIGKQVQPYWDVFKF